MSTKRGSSAEIVIDSNVRTLYENLAWSPLFGRRLFLGPSCGLAGIPARTIGEVNHDE
jgi:hypothetical protein